MSTLTIRKVIWSTSRLSGVGKTTLAKIVMGIYHPEKFRMMWRDNITEELQRVSGPKNLGKTGRDGFQHADEALNLESAVFRARGLPLKESF